MLDQPIFLYVEDEPMSRMVMKILMDNGLGYKNLLVWEDSTNFEERLANLPEVPRIVFLDIHVKPYDGFQMLAMLRLQARFQQTKVIALTASVMSEEVQLLRNAGFDGGIAKPIEATAFPNIIQAILAGQEVWYIT
jgi:CheY-like chemotaxis protein